MLESHFSDPLCPPGHYYLLSPSKGVIWGDQKTAGGSLGTARLAFKDDPGEHAGDGHGEHAGGGRG